MKKQFCLFSIVFGFTFAFFSCTKTVEDRIRKEFKTYVHQNFDDPESLKEILSITFEDTVSAKGTTELLRGIIAKYDTTFAGLKHLDDSLSNKITDMIQKPKAISKLYGDEKILRLLRKSMNIAEEKVDYLCSAEYSKFKYNKATLDEILSELESDSSCFVTYKIKTRVEKHGELSLTEYYARIDKNDSIAIYDSNAMDTYPQLFTDAFKQLDLYTETLKKELTFYERNIDNSNDIIRYIQLKLN